FSSPGGHRDLPSFPTRRSSDLLSLPRSDTPFELPRWPESLPDIAPPLELQADDIRIDDLAIRRDAQPLITIASARGGLDASDGRDRKSTRLNSSHVKISYAVFC